MSNDILPPYHPKDVQLCVQAANIRAAEARRHRRLAWLRRAQAFLLGMYEFRRSLTTNPGLDLFESYEQGREFAHRITFRHFDHL